MLSKLFKIAILLSIIYLLYFFIYEKVGFSSQNYLLSILTLSSFLPLFVIEKKEIANLALLKKMLSFLLYLFFFEGILGIVQGIYGFIQNGFFDVNNGDTVQGTIFPHLRTDNTLSNPMFAISMVLIFIGLLVYFLYFKEKGLWKVCVGLVAIIMASVVHAIIFLAIAIFFAFLLTKPNLEVFGSKRKKYRFYVGLSVIIVIFTTYYFVGNNFKEIPIIFNQLVNEQVPRAEIILNVLQDIPKEFPVARWIGLGPGQFSSRASLIGSGIYIGGFYTPSSIKFLHPDMPLAVREYLYPLIKGATGITWYTSTFQPYFSLLAILAETGVIGLGLFLYFFLKIVTSAVKRASGDPEKKILSFVFLTGAFFIFLLGFQENYYEMPQAIFIGALILNVIYALIVSNDKEPKEGT